MIPISAATAVIKITSVDERIFSERYFARCLESPCHDICCSYGCPVDIAEVARILACKNGLEARLHIPATEWFVEETDSRPEFPSGKVKRTRTGNGRCVFHDSASRGCYLHRFAVENGLDPHWLKPMVCFLFPLTWDGPCLYVSEFLDELPCKSTGTPVLESQREDLKFYLGTDFVKELEQIQSRLCPI